MEIFEFQEGDNSLRIIASFQLLFHIRFQHKIVQFYSNLDQKKQNKRKPMDIGSLLALIPKLCVHSYLDTISGVVWIYTSLKDFLSIFLDSRVYRFAQVFSIAIPQQISQILCRLVIILFKKSIAPVVLDHHLCDTRVLWCHSWRRKERRGGKTTR